MQHVVLVARYAKRSQRQSNNHTDYAHQRTPDAEAEQNSRRTETGYLTHNLRRKEHILKRLYDDEYNRHQQQGQPYRLTSLC